MGLPSHLLDKGLATLCLDHVAGLLCRRPRPEAFVVFAERVFFREGCLVGAQVLVEGNLEVGLLQTLIAAVAEWSASTVRDRKGERREWETDGRGAGMWHTLAAWWFRRIQRVRFCEASAGREGRQTWWIWRALRVRDHATQGMAVAGELGGCSTMWRGCWDCCGRGDREKGNVMMRRGA